MRETDASAFSKLLKRAAQPRPQQSSGTSEFHSSADCNGKKIHSRTSGDASGKRDGKSH
jgi:hypothetical protein